MVATLIRFLASGEKHWVFAIFHPDKPPTHKLKKSDIFWYRFNSKSDYKIAVVKIGFC